MTDNRQERKKRMKKNREFTTVYEVDPGSFRVVVTARLKEGWEIINSGFTVYGPDHSDVHWAHLGR